MEIIEGKLYFIKDEFIIKYNPKYHLMENNEINQFRIHWSNYKSS